MQKYRVREAARADLKEIGRYTLKKWGVKQRDKYLRQLNKRFSLLAENPYLGKSRDDVKSGYFSYNEGSHVIFYLVKKDFIEILSVLHERMEPALHL